MSLPKFKQSITSMVESKYTEVCENIIAGLTDNPYFPTIEKPRKAFEAIFKKYRGSIPTPSERNSINTAVKNANREECNKMLLRLIGYVTYEAAYDLGAMRSTNIPMAKGAQPKGEVGAVEGLMMTASNEIGVIEVKCQDDVNATKYLARVSTDEQNWFAFGFNTNKTVHVRDLPTGVQLFVQMQLENGHSSSPWSASVTGMLPEPHMMRARG